MHCLSNLHTGIYKYIYVVAIAKAIIIQITKGVVFASNYKEQKQQLHHEKTVEKDCNLCLKAIMQLNTLYFTIYIYDKHKRFESVRNCFCERIMCQNVVYIIYINAEII